jgi:hypothetical protein
MKRILVFLIFAGALTAAAQTERRIAFPPPPVALKCSITTTDTEGVADNFGGGIDPTTLSPALTAYLNANPPRSQYDQPGCDKHFGESFKVCSCETCGGRLEIVVRRCGSNMDTNDGFVVGVAPFNAATQRVAQGPVWAAGDPQTKTLFIPLPAAKLTEILCKNKTQWLDVYIQDDTIVDSMKLTILHP